MLHITLYGCFLSRSEILDMFAPFAQSSETMLVFDYKQRNFALGKTLFNKKRNTVIYGSNSALKKRGDEISRSVQPTLILTLFAVGSIVVVL